MIVLAGADDTKDGRLIGELYQKLTNNKLINKYSAIGWIRSGTRQDGKIEIIAIAIFDNYTGSNIDMHIWGSKGFSRRFIKGAYTYAFEQLKCNRVTGRIHSTNKNLLQLMDRTGFVYECTLKDYAGPADNPVDVLIYKITRQQALEWMSKHGRFAKSSTPS